MQPLHQIAFEIIWLAICGYALARGGAPERIMALAIILAVVSTNIATVVLRHASSDYARVELGVAVTDAALFILTLVLALTSARFWPMPMASMLGCELLGHVARPLGPDIIPRAYYAMVAIWGYPALILLAIATWRHRARLKRYGADCAWVRDLPPRYRDGWSIHTGEADPPPA